MIFHRGAETAHRLMSRNDSAEQLPQLLTLIFAALAILYLSNSVILIATLFLLS